MRQHQMILSACATPNQGGQGLNLRHMIEGLRQSFDLSLFCRAEYDGVQTQVVPPSRIGANIGKTPILRRLHDWNVFFTERHFDHYVAARLHKASIFQGVTGQCAESLSVAKKLGCRTVLDVITLHIEDYAAAQEQFSAHFNIRPHISLWARQRFLQEYERADVIRVMSELARRSFLSRGFDPQRVVTIPPPIDFDQFQPAQFTESKFRISFVGQIEPWKGFHYLINAFNRLDLQESELVLWGGPGSRPVTRYLREQMALNPRIIVRPVVVRRLGYGEVYGKSSVLVLPSLADGFGYVVAEAMASGIPVIVTDKTGAADLVVDGQNGYIVPAADSDAIRDRLAHLAEHPSLLKRMGQAARETARTLTFDSFRTRQRVYLDALAV